MDQVYKPAFTLKTLTLESLKTNKLEKKALLFVVLFFLLGVK